MSENTDTTPLVYELSLQENWSHARYRISGGSRKTMSGWRLVGGGGDYGKKKWFSKGDNLVSFSVLLRKKRKITSWGGGGGRFAEQLDPPVYRIPRFNIDYSCILSDIVEILFCVMLLKCYFVWRCWDIILFDIVEILQGDWKVTSYFKFFITLIQQKISSWFFHHLEAWTMPFCSRWNKLIDRLTV